MKLTKKLIKEAIEETLEEARSVDYVKKSRQSLRAKNSEEAMLYALYAITELQKKVNSLQANSNTYTKSDDDIY